MLGEIEKILEEVLSFHKDEVKTHYETCYRYHVACLAVLLQDLLADEDLREGFEHASK